MMAVLLTFIVPIVVAFCVGGLLGRMTGKWFLVPVFLILGVGGSAVLLYSAVTTTDAQSGLGIFFGLILLGASLGAAAGVAFGIDTSSSE